MDGQEAQGMSIVSLIPQLQLGLDSTLEMMKPVNMNDSNGHEFKLNEGRKHHVTLGKLELLDEFWKHRSTSDIPLSHEKKALMFVLYCSRSQSNREHN